MELGKNFEMPATKQESFHMPDFLKEISVGNLDFDAPIAKVENSEATHTILDCRNEHLEGKTHPDTDVPFERKTVQLDNGDTYEGVFAQFDSKCDVQLPKELYTASIYKQNKECNAQLLNAVENDPKLKSQFTSEQLEQIRDGLTPDGCTWHHNEKQGKMQLVDSKTHANTAHTGGNSIWGPDSLKKQEVNS